MLKIGGVNKYGEVYIRNDIQMDLFKEKDLLKKRNIHSFRRRGVQH